MSLSPSNTARSFNLTLTALAVGFSGAVVCAIAAGMDLARLMDSYLLGYLYWWEMTLGCLGLALIHSLVGGPWGRSCRPYFRAGIRTLPLMAVLFLPVLLTVQEVFPWAESHFQEEYRQKALYLNPPFFVGRAAVYFAVWLPLGVVATRALSGRRTSPGLVAAGLVLLFFTASFAAIDWGMSLDPHWFSSIYGALLAVGGAVTGLSLSVLMVSRGAARNGVGESITRHDLNDLGNLLLAVLMVWAYFAFSQFLIIWSANLPEETVWYYHRAHGGWQWLVVAVIALNFFLPFLLLLSRSGKRSPGMLGGVALLLLVMHYVEHHWTIAPSLYGEELTVRWTDPLTMLAIGGLWLAVFFHGLGKAPPDESPPRAERQETGPGEADLP